MTRGGHTHYSFSDAPYITSRFEYPPGSGQSADGKRVGSLMTFVLKALKICPNKQPEEKGRVDFTFRLSYDEDRPGAEDWDLGARSGNTKWEGGPTPRGSGIAP